MTRHSSIVGGSTADRLLECPGSYQATLALPPSANVSSSFAAEGTAMHAVMDAIMRERMMQELVPVVVPWGVSSKPTLYDIALGLVGRHFVDRELTKSHIEEMIFPALNHLEDLEEIYGGGFKVVGVEMRVKFPGIPGAFGTCDLMLQSDRWVLHIDWKFGSGVGVRASYVEGKTEKLNAQMMFYTTAAKATEKKLYGSRKLAIAIIQPRVSDALTHARVSRTDIKWFTEDLENAVIAAIDRDPVRKRGEHCRFAPCKINCPKWTGPMIDLSALGINPTSVIPNDGKAEYGEFLAKAKDLVDIAAQYKKEVDEQMHSFLEEGGVIPGWRLKAKTKLRQWIDEPTVEKSLNDLGFKPWEIWQEKLVTFSSAEATAKKLGVKIPAELRVAPASTETTVCRTDDPAPVVEPATVLKEFQASLKQLLNKA